MPFDGLPLLLVLLLLLLAAALWITGRRKREESGLPDGDVIYTDTGAWRSNNQVLFARALRLSGKPDYLVEAEDGFIIPVELKSSLAPPTPYAGQLLQLAAYCLLVEENYGVRPPYGILQYRDQAIAVDYSAELEADLVNVLDEMRHTAGESDVEPDHNSPRRCISCGVREACNYRLA